MDVNKTKGLTAIILKDSANDKNLPKMELIDGKNWIGIRVTNKGKVTDIIINQLSDGTLMHSNSWIYAEGWETDAAVFAVSYAEGGKPENTTEMVMAYGSALRRNDISYIAALSKMYTIVKNDGKTLSVELKGQPLVTAEFYSKSNPGFIMINGKKTLTTYQNQQLKIKLDTRK